MRALEYAASNKVPHLIDAVQHEDQIRNGARAALIDKNIILSTIGLEKYFFAKWEPLLVDLMVVAAAIEYCDIVHRRPPLGWARSFDVRIAVHLPEIWQKSNVQNSIVSAANLLTGDKWKFSFEKRTRPAERAQEQLLELGSSAKIVMPYSDGLDSRAVAALIASQERDSLVRVRLGARGSDQSVPLRRRYPFTVVPYAVRVSKRDRRESSVRSRGFKFSVVTGAAAHLSGVKRVVVTESGQGIFGPVLTVSGHMHPDYRVHPTFLRKIESIFYSLFGESPRYEFPRIWSTKGETIAAAIALPSKFDLSNTRSCWQQSRQVSVDGRRIQCGVCAACLLRRISMHRAGLSEPRKTYVCDDLSLPSLDNCAALGFSRIGRAFREYAIAGVLYLDHLASMAESKLHLEVKRRIAREVASAEDINSSTAEKNLQELLERHRDEWINFMRHVGSKSFIYDIASVRP
ncbi:7-cyano-7-deazaguanine synthase [Methylobacterium variabile]|jgi:7-cyano-7-deazaguanine synthase in queuosine biosynthesis|uniref:7-cyano-7-deazaguanine synthase n=1 Tax=Methylobacterium variabile TaxID=298794 RepID=UPI000A58BA54|nr:7-cyano-7-deazaguanine synthase [Methylobacterium variabile]